MGIRFHCPNCDKRLNVKAFLAGKRGICPYCDTGLDIPLESEETNGTATTTTKSVEVRTVARQGEADQESPPAAASSTTLADTAVADAGPQQDQPDPIDEAPDAVWYVRPPSGGQFGPAKGDVMRKWLAEGRVSPEALVWREGWTDWLAAEPVFPCLQSRPAPPPPTSSSSTPPPAPGKPAPKPTAVATPAAARTVAADPHLDAKVESKPASASKAYAKRRSNLPALIAVVALVIVSFLLLIALGLVFSGVVQFG